MYHSQEDETPLALLLLLFPCFQSPQRVNDNVFDLNVMTQWLTSQPTPWVLFFPVEPQAAVGFYNGAMQ